jgi:cold shock CspA family protein
MNQQRSNTMSTKLYATVLFFQKGWGFAELDTDRTAIYLHHSDIIGRKLLHENDRITCFVEPSGHPKNPLRARQIELTTTAQVVVTGVRQ